MKNAKNFPSAPQENLLKNCKTSHARGLCPLDSHAYAASARGLCPLDSRACAASARALPCTRACAASARGLCPLDSRWG